MMKEIDALGLKDADNQEAFSFIQQYALSKGITDMTPEIFKEIEFQYKMSIVKNATHKEDLKNVVLDLNAAPEFFKKTFTLNNQVPQKAKQSSRSYMRSYGMHMDFRKNKKKEKTRILKAKEDSKIELQQQTLSSAPLKQ